MEIIDSRTAYQNSQNRDTDRLEIGGWDAQSDAYRVNAVINGDRTYGLLPESFVTTLASKIPDIDVVREHTQLKRIYLDDATEDHRLQLGAALDRRDPNAPEEKQRYGKEDVLSHGIDDYDSRLEDLPKLIDGESAHGYDCVGVWYDDDGDTWTEIVSDAQRFKIRNTRNRVIEIV